ncbi:hypothetical protein, partial [Plasmodium yoelii yoelii]
CFKFIIHLFDQLTLTYLFTIKERRNSFCFFFLKIIK